MAVYKNKFHDVTVTLRFAEEVTLKEATRQARDGMLYWHFRNCGMDGITNFDVSSVGAARITTRRKPGIKTESLIDQIISEMEPRAGEIMMYCEKLVRFIGVGSDAMDVYYIADELDRRGKIKRTWLTAVAAIVPLKGLIDPHVYAYHDRRMEQAGSAKCSFLLQEDDGFNVTTLRGKAPAQVRGQERHLQAFCDTLNEIRGEADYLLTSEFHRACAMLPDREAQQRLLDRLWSDPVALLSSKQARLPEMDLVLQAVFREKKLVDDLKSSALRGAIRSALRKDGQNAALKAYEESCDRLDRFAASTQSLRMDLDNCLTGIWYALNPEIACSLNALDEDEAYEEAVRLVLSKMPFAHVFLRAWLAERPALRAAAIARGVKGDIQAKLWPLQAMIYANYEDVRENPNVIGLTNEEADAICVELHKAAAPVMK